MRLPTKQLPSAEGPGVIAVRTTEVEERRDARKGAIRGFEPMMGVTRLDELIIHCQK